MRGELYLKAASLIETVMAITIITLCSLVGTMVYSSVLSSTPPMVRYSYEAAREESIEKTVKGEKVEIGTEIRNNFSIENILNKNRDEELRAIEIVIKTSLDTLRTPLFYSRIIDE